MQQQHRFAPNPSGGTQRRNPNLNSNIMALPHQQLQVRQQTEHQDHNTNSSLAPPPLFERLATEEAAELKTYSRIIESQNRRLSDLEVSHEDLEQRLERETQKRISLQQDLDRQNLVWQNKYETLEKDRDVWKNMVNAERARNERLLDQVMRKDREIHRMIQRKYDAKGSQHPNLTNQGLPHSSNVNRNSPNQTSNGKVVHKSPHELLAAKGSGDVVREHNITSSLQDFFGF